MKTPNYLILVSTGSCPDQEVSKATIIEKHTSSRAHGGLGFSRPGFDYLVQRDGHLETILSEEHPNETDLWGLSDGVEGINGRAKFVAYTGGQNEAGKAKDTRTEAQTGTLAALVNFYIRRFPNIRVLGWDQLPGKERSGNPGFVVTDWLQELDIPSANLYPQPQ